MQNNNVSCTSTMLPFKKCFSPHLLFWFLRLAELPYGYLYKMAPLCLANTVYTIGPSSSNSNLEDVTINWYTFIGAYLYTSDLRLSFHHCRFANDANIECATHHTIQSNGYTWRPRSDFFSDIDGFPFLCIFVYRIQEIKLLLLLLLLI